MATQNGMTSQTKSVLSVILIIFLAILAYGFLTMPDQRTSGEKIGDAIDALPQGVDDAVEQLEDRTPGEKLGDAIEDATDKD